MTLNRGKILVIDDLPDWRAMVGGLLQDAGYDVQTAADASQAMHLLRQQPYHVAVVDMRLDEEDEHNKEGLILAEQMKTYAPELAILVLTAHADIPAVKRALQPREDGLRVAFDFIEKHEIAKLLPSVENAFLNGVKVNPQLDIKLDPTLSWSQLQENIECLQPLETEEARLEITDLLQRIFHEAERVEIKSMNNGHSSGSVVLITPMMRNIIQTDVVVKFNEREKAERESRNYDRYVGNFVGGARRTQRLDFRATAKLGGIAYSFVGAEAREFQRLSRLYASEDVETIRVVIDNLFRETCHTWYTNTLTSNQYPQSLSVAYQTWLRLDGAKIMTALKKIIEQTKMSHLAFSDPRRPGQSDILFSERGVRLVNPLPLSRLALVYNGLYAFSHGDLHEGNILVDSHHETWLIDFYHTGPGHPVRDFAMLESAIKFSLQQSTCSLSILYDWERSLHRVTTLTAEPTSDPPLQLDAELMKATKLILHLRSLIDQILPAMTLRDYQISLYFHALKGMTLPSKLSERQRVHALISASLLAEILSPVST